MLQQWVVIPKAAAYMLAKLQTRPQNAKQIAVLLIPTGLMPAVTILRLLLVSS